MMDLAFHRLDWINMSCPSNPVWFSLPWHGEGLMGGGCVCVCVCVCVLDYFLAQHFYTIMLKMGPRSSRWRTELNKDGKVYSPPESFDIIESAAVPGSIGLTWVVNN